jgi:hypothetical protein
VRKSLLRERRKVQPKLILTEVQQAEMFGRKGRGCEGVKDRGNRKGVRPWKRERRIVRTQQRPGKPL